MKTIIAGSRSITDMTTVQEAITRSGWEEKITEVVSGNAVGVDRLGEMWAMRKNIRVKRFLAEWDRYGKSAGMIRNREMAEYGDALILVWDGESKGSRNMMEIMNKLGKPVLSHLRQG